ncbi:hypothetical protein [Saccharibacillus sp. WB 17]|nr:hypothetical protein [Saccharibacillus sp. WB 17]MWJ30760.1 hypothetical protein [Saccharibacillus sp. WB 17]
MKKIVTAAMASVMLMTTVVSSAFAENSTEILLADQTDLKISAELKQKADPYVTLEKSQFKLSPEAFKVLNKDEISLVTSALETANLQAKLILDDDQGYATIERDSIKIRFTAPAEPSDEIAINAINTSSYYDFEVLWWGNRNFFSHALIQDIKSHTLYVASTGGIATGLLNGTLTKLGIPGWISNIIIGVVVFTGARMVYTDQGRGVYVDTFWGGGIVGGPINFSASKIYAAW